MNTTAPIQHPVLKTALEWQEDFARRFALGPPRLNITNIQVDALEYAADIAMEYIVDGLKNQYPAQAILDRLVAKMAQIQKEARQ
jgi:hypothetical protein